MLSPSNTKGEAMQPLDHDAKPLHNLHRLDLFQQLLLECWIALMHWNSSAMIKSIFDATSCTTNRLKHAVSQLLRYCLLISISTKDHPMTLLLSSKQRKI